MRAQLGCERSWGRALLLSVPGVPRGGGAQAPPAAGAAGGDTGAGPVAGRIAFWIFFFSLSDTGIQRETVEMHNLQSKLLLICALLCPFAVALGFFGEGLGGWGVGFVLL